MNCCKLSITLGMLLIILFSCGTSEVKIQMAKSLDEAKILAAEKGAFIVVEFWRHG